MTPSLTLLRRHPPCPAAICKGLSGCTEVSGFLHFKKYTMSCTGISTASSSPAEPAHSICCLRRIKAQIKTYETVKFQLRSCLFLLFKVMFRSDYVQSNLKYVYFTIFSLPGKLLQCPLQGFTGGCWRNLDVV